MRGLVPARQRRCLWALTGEATPSGDVAGGAVGEDQTLLWEAGGCDGGGEADGRRQLDQGDVVAAAYRGNTAVVSHLAGLR